MPAAVTQYNRRPMDFSCPPEAEAFRAELRAWLEAHLSER